MYIFQRRIMPGDTYAGDDSISKVSFHPFLTSFF